MECNGHRGRGIVSAATLLPTLLALWLAFGAQPAAAQEGLTDTACLHCHDRQDSLWVDTLALSQSAHTDLACTGCHVDVTVLPHPAKPGPVNCLDCHENSTDVQGKPVGRWHDSVHGRAVAASPDSSGAATCTDCHGRHDIRGQDDPLSMVNRRNIPLTCARCHEDNRVVLKHDIHAEAPYHEYESSVHGKALYKDGLLQVAAVCTDCHGVHTIQAAGDSLPMAAQPATCGKCHTAVYDTYRSSIHGQLHLEKHDPNAPGCIDCHGEHGIQAPTNAESPISRANIPKTCASCHADQTRMAQYDISTDRMETYKQSFHGTATGLGDQNAANCASCHGWHDVYPAADPRSSVNPQNMLKTCGKCHPKATANFIVGKIHVDVRAKSAGTVYYLRQVLIWLAWAVGAFVAVWMVLDIILKKRRGRDK